MKCCKVVEMHITFRGEQSNAAQTSSQWQIRSTGWRLGRWKRGPRHVWGDLPGFRGTLAVLQDHWSRWMPIGHVTRIRSRINVCTSLILNVHAQVSKCIKVGIQRNFQVIQKFKVPRGKKHALTVSLKEVEVTPSSPTWSTSWKPAPFWMVESKEYRPVGCGECGDVDRL